MCTQKTILAVAEQQEGMKEIFFYEIRRMNLKRKKIIQFMKEVKEILRGVHLSSFSYNIVNIYLVRSPRDIPYDSYIYWSLLP